MSIDLNKPFENGNGGGNSSSSGGSNASTPNYGDPNSSPEVREIYRFAYECKQKKMPDYQIEQSLQNKGLDQIQATTVLRIVNQAYQNREQSQQPSSDDSGGGGGASIPRFVWYIGILILINVLSAAFGWGFWIY